jgi:hypothetical protein
MISKATATPIQCNRLSITGGIKYDIARHDLPAALSLGLVQREIGIPEQG